MDIVERIVEYYVTTNGKAPFKLWLKSLKDYQGVDIIYSKIEQLKLGNFIQCIPVGSGVLESRIFFGPGYRIYFSVHGGNIILLLMGGDKSTQQKDIKRAQNYWEDYQRRNKV